MSSHTVLTSLMIETLTFDTVLFRLIGGVSAKNLVKNLKIQTYSVGSTDRSILGEGRSACTCTRSLSLSPPPPRYHDDEKRQLREYHAGMLIFRFFPVVLGPNYFRKSPVASLIMTSDQFHLLLSGVWTGGCVSIPEADQNKKTCI